MVPAGLGTQLSCCLHCRFERSESGQGFVDTNGAYSSGAGKYRPILQDFIGKLFWPAELIHGRDEVGSAIAVGGRTKIAISA